MYIAKWVAGWPNAERESLASRALPCFVRDMKHFGQMPDGEDVFTVTIGSDRISATVLTLGARLNSVSLDGSPDLVWGPTSVNEALGEMIYAGPIIGPVINRIGGATAPLGNTNVTMDANQDGRHSLHSGHAGTQSKVWRIEARSDDTVTLSVDLPDGEGGLPGNRRITVTYTISGAEISLKIQATTDADTLMNVGHHGYWNLNGSPDWTGHKLQVSADQYLPTDTETVPTGDIASVDGTIYDLRTAIEPSSELDTNFCLRGDDGPIAKLTGCTGRKLDIFSDAPGLQVYSGHARAIALEAQIWPDAPNHDGFPSIRLGAGEVFHQTTLYVLS